MSATPSEPAVKVETVADHSLEARLVTGLARALLHAGAPSHRIEASIAVVCRRLGTPVQVFATPTAVIASLGDADDQRTAFVRAQPAEVDITRLTELHEMVADLREDRCTVSEMLHRLEALEALQTAPAASIQTLAFTLVSAGAATFFGGGWPEVLIASLVGLQTGLLARLVANRESMAGLFTPTAAFLAGLTAWMSVYLVGNLSPYVVTIAGLIVLVPGLSLTVATRELAEGHLVAGGARMAGAGVVFLLLAFGVAMGSQLGRSMNAFLGVVATDTLPVPLPEVAILAALMAVSVGLTVLFRVPPRFAIWVLVAGALALVGGRLGAAFLGPVLGAGAGALLVGVGGNLFSRILDRPAAIFQIPGIMLLVPGSIGFRSVASLLDNDVLSGVQAAFTAVMVAVAIATGLLIAAVLVPQRRVL